MATSVVSSLSLTAGVGLYQNTALTVNTAFTTNRASYESTSLIANLVWSINEAATNESLAIDESTLNSLKAIGANVSANYFPALGDSLSSNLTANVGNVGLIGNINSAANTYLASSTRFIQMFGSASGYCGLVNPLIESAANANNYLGPTFSGMDALISSDASKVNLAYEAFGNDIQALGNSFRLDNFGTPAGLMQQISLNGNMVNGTTTSLETACLAQGLTPKEIADLVNNNIQSLFNPDGLLPGEFDSLQRLAYQAMQDITGTNLAEILDILGVTTPNIMKLSDLLDPVLIFPNSWPSLTLPTPGGPILIYDNQAKVNPQVIAILNSNTITPVGCDQLAKIIPQDQAASNRALQVAFAQIKNASNITLNQLAEALN